MDYGQLAYMKAEEIENYLRSRAAKQEKRNSIGASFYPRCELSGGYEPCELTGSGSVGLIVAASVRAPRAIAGIKVRLYAGDKIAAYTSVTLGANETGGYLLLASVTPTESGEKIRIESSGDGLVLEELHILADGDDASLVQAGEYVKCDYRGEETFLLREENGYATLEKYGGDKVSVAHGSTYDLACDESGVNVICADDVGNLWGVCYDGALNECARVNLGDAPAKAALGLGQNGGLTIAGVFDGQVRTCECDAGFAGKTDWTRVAAGIAADDVHLSKQTPLPVLVIRSGKSLYAKLPLPAASVRDCVRTHVSLEIT